MNQDGQLDSRYRLEELKLEVTHRCNLRCVHCSSEGGPERENGMTREDALRIVNEARLLGVEHLAVSGGEAILWGPIKELLAAWSTAETKLSLYASGIADQAPDVIQTMSRIQNSHIIFSLYSHRPEVHDAITQCHGSHGQTLRMVHLAVALGVRTELHFTAMRTNYRDLPAVARVAASLGVGRVSLLRLVPHGRAREAGNALLLSREDNLLLRKAVTEASQEMDIRVGSPYGFLDVSGSPRCSAGVDTLIVSPSLVISPCDAFKRVRPEEIAGTDDYSRLDRWSLADCWEKSPYLNAIRKHLREPHVLPCRECSAFEKCYSGCTAQRFIANGRLVRGPDPMCLRRVPDS